MNEQLKNFSDATKNELFHYHAYMRKLAYGRGKRGSTFATHDELTWPGYDRAYRAGARRRGW